MIPSPVPSYDLFVGIDIAAATASVAWMTSKQTASRAITIDQTPQGFSLLRQRLLATGHSAKTVLIVMEATGSYWMNLATTLTQAGFAVSVINPAQAHHFAKALLKRAKTDAIDAQTLAQLASLLQPTVWNPPPAIFVELYQRLTERESLMQMRQQIRNQLHALTHCPTVITAVRTRMEHLIEACTKQIIEVEAELDAALTLDPSWTASATRLQTITGIGQLTAIWLLVTTLNFTLCDTVEELTAYAGLAPHPYQSGTSVHGRACIGHTGNAALRTAVYLATLSAAQYNPVIKAFYDRLRAAGKPMKVARCAAARKLLHIAFAVVTNKEDFDPGYAAKPRKAA
jgi:transposase